MAEPLLNDLDSLASIPTGTVTFLFTDIQGSTQLLERLRDQYALVLAEQRDVLRAVFARWNGHEIDTQGDAFFVAFPRALDAVNCAIEAQRALAAHTWPQHITVYVRMGLHTGEPILARTGYVGMDVHLAARIGAAGHGGQVLLSQTTQALVYQDLPTGVTLRDLGAHKLKDIRYPQDIYQLDIQDLMREFPPLKTLATGEEPPTPGNPPFKGLQFFDEADAALFFGREVVTAQLVERLQAQRFLAIIGASGSGKSSIVRAGVVPALKRQPTSRWQIHVLTPGAHPLEALATSLTHTAESLTATAILIDDLARDARSLHLFSKKNTPASRLLIVVDQFEELFTLCRNATERQAFVDNLLHVQSAEGSATTIAIVLRADFYEHLAQYATLREAVAKQQEYLGPMSTAELREAIEEPARRGGWEFSPGLVDLMLHDVGATSDQQPEPGALPLLSHALLETWRRRRGNVMTLKGYSESGGVRGAIARTAETVFFTELTAEQRPIARSVFLRLTELGDGTQDTRRRATLDELFPPAPFASPAQVEDVLVKLADARLITTGEGTVEVAHEALIREWSTLRDWLTQNREGLRLHRHLTEAAQEWELLERDASVLYRGTRLAQAVDWAGANPRELNAQEQAFLSASKDLATHEEVEREAQRRRELETAQKLAETEQHRAEEQTQAVKRLRLRNRVVVAAGVLAIIAAIVAIIFGRQANTNEQLANQNLGLAQAANTQVAEQRNVALDAQATAVAESQVRATQQALAEANFTRAEAQRLANEASNLLLTGGNVDQIALLSLRSMNLQYSPRGDMALNGASRLHFPQQTFLGHTGSINAVAFSPDGRYVLTGGEDKTARLWDIQTGQQIRQLGVLYGSVASLAFSPDGESALIGGSDYRAILADVKTGNMLHTFSRVCLANAAFSSDGKYIVIVTTGYCNGSSRQDVVLFDAQTGRTLRVFNIGGGMQEAALSPDGQFLASVHDNGLARLWSVQTGQEIRTFSGHTSSIKSVAFSPEGKYLLTACSDTTARLWDVGTGHEVHVFSDHTDEVNAAAFSPDGKNLVTGSRDGTARLWEVNPKSELPEFMGHSGAVRNIAFSPDGQYVLTGSDDHTARVWDAHTGQQLRTFVGHDNTVWRVAFSPDGQFAFTGSVDQTVRLWNVKSGEELMRFTIGSDWWLGPPVSVDFSPDHHYVIASYKGPYIAWWSLDTGTLTSSFVPNEANVANWGSAYNVDALSASAISADGKQLLTASVDHVVTLYNFPQGTRQRRFIGHTDLIAEVAFSPDGRYALTGSLDKTARLWDSQTGQEMQRFIGHAAGVQTVTYSPDGKTVGTGSQDGTARIWDAQTGQELRRFDVRVPIFSIRFSPDAKYLLIGSSDGAARPWDVDYHDTMRYVCGRLQRDLTEAERKQYGITDTSPTCPAKATP